LAAISVSGGAAGLMSDLAADCGVKFSPLTEDTRDKLREVVPEFGNVGNPLDVTGQGVFQPDLLERSLDLLASDPGVDTILYARSFPSRIDAVTPAHQAVTRAQAAHPEIPILAMSLAGGHFFPSAVLDTPPQQPVDRLDGVPFLQGAEYGLRAVGALNRYAEFLRDRSHARRPHDSMKSGTAEVARGILARARGGRLSAQECSAVLAAYDIATPAEMLVTSPEEAVSAAEQIGYPVAAKIEAPSLAHKARAGGVALNLRTSADVADAFDRVRVAATDADGVLIQQMIVDGRAEVIVGMSHDPQFGPVIACGLGGVLVEVLRDVQLLLPPMTESHARAALARLRGAPLLEGLDVDALINLLLEFSHLCLDLGDHLQEVDLNPLLVRPAGGGVVAVDSLFVLQA
jgi:acetyltransferase